MSDANEVQILDTGQDCPTLPIVEGEGEARAVVWPGMGASMRSMHRVSLGSGSRTVELTHPMEAVYYVISGSAEALDASDGSRHPLVEGSYAHVEPGTPYAIVAGEQGAELMGGPCPPDPALYEHLEG